MSHRTPIIADLKPGGRYVANDVDKAGGIPLIIKRLIESGHIDGSQMTPTGRTLAEETTPSLQETSANKSDAVMAGLLDVNRATVVEKPDSARMILCIGEKVIDATETVGTTTAAVVVTPSSNRRMLMLG